VGHPEPNAVGQAVAGLAVTVGVICNTQNRNLQHPKPESLELVMYNNGVIYNTKKEALMLQFTKTL
jgi:hypothetical protein